MNLLSISEQWEVFLGYFPKEKASFETLIKKMGYEFQNKNFLFEALTHRSAVVEIRGKLKPKKLKLPDINWNEKVEFLGDSVLGLVVSARLWHEPIADSEGVLSKLRAGLVNEKTLAKLAKNLGVCECLILGKGEEKSGARQRDSLLADTLEAIFGAIYLDSCFEDTAKIINCLYDDIFEQGLEGYLYSDYKTRLQEFSQEKFQTAPTYKVLDETGPDHSKVFVTQCLIGTKIIAQGTGKSKKESSQIAALAAFNKLTGG